MNKALIVILFCFCGLQNVWPQAQPPANAPADLNRNFVRTEKILAPGVTSENSVSNLPVEQKATTYAYVDDMGRPVQSITVQGSPEKRDVVQFHHYDAFGRQPQEYLPYTFNNSTGYGTYRTGYLAEQASFYTGTPAIAQDVAPYKLNIFDNSPLNQVRTFYGPGVLWHPTHANKPVRSKITTNSTNEVRKWTYTGTGFPSTGTSDYYAGNILLATEEIDEENFVRLTYKNFKDQVILEKTGDGTAWHETYYVYDYAGNLMFVFPPEAVARLETEYIPAGANKQQFLDRWVFQYEYDAWQRMTGKKVPGSGWVYHIYDKWDRLILTQDANQRASNQWTFTKYDELNRPVLTGFTTGSRSALQNSVNAINNRFFETRNSNSIGYTNAAFPSHSESNLLTITYYDDYTFRNYPNWDETPGSTFNFVGEAGFPSTAQILDPVKGYTTGTKTKVLGENRWLNTVTYYDKKYNTIQVTAENYIGGKDRITNDIDFAGRTLKTLHVHTSTMASVTKLAQFTYDHAGRLENVYLTLDNGSPVLVASHKYNELGQLIEKNLHSEDEGNTFLQSVDYRYNIRGWLTHINNSTLTNDGTINNDVNDLFGMDIIYNQEQVSVGGTNTTKLYNGNISSIRWKSNNLWDPPKEKIYRYQYDPWSRMQLAYYAHKNGSSWNDAPGAFNETVGYDKNGNIQNLLRTGLMGAAITEIDNLGYQYTGNQLKNVHDYSEHWWLDYGNPDIGFSEIFHDTGLTEYTYDANGNMTSDMNKGIESITYNYLNLPVQITLENNRFIEYTYDALGNKLRTIARVGSDDVKSKTEYVGSIHYQDSQLAFILTDEGRLVKRNGAFENEYFIKDHQRNVRVVFGPLKVTEAFKATLEPERNNRETADFQNITRAVGYNHTPKNYETPHPQYGASLNGAVGPAKMLHVQQGDKLRLTAHSRYKGGTNSSSKLTLEALVSAVTTVFQVFPTGETSSAYNALNGGIMGAAISEDPNVPKAYLCYFIFNSSYTWHQFGYYAVSNASTVAFEQLQLDVEVNFPAGSSTGFIYVYVANETTGKAVVFDDIEIIHEKNQRALQVVQASDYYPFGLRIPLSYQKPILDLARTKNKYTFQEQEVQDGFDLNWYQYKYRMHDPAIGRFGAVDPLAEDYYYNSVYAFSENRLVDGVELEGLEQVPANEIWNIHHVPVQSLGLLSDWHYMANIGGIPYQFFQIQNGLNENNYYGRAYLGTDDSGYRHYRWDYVVGADRISEIAGQRLANLDVGGIGSKYNKYAFANFAGTFKYTDYINPGKFDYGSWLVDQWTSPENYIIGATAWASSVRVAAKTSTQSLGAGRTGAKQWLQNVGNLERGTLIQNIESAGFKRMSPATSPVSVFERGGMRIRLDPPQSGTPFNHMHLEYGGNSYNIFLNPVNYRSPLAHIPIR